MYHLLKDKPTSIFFLVCYIRNNMSKYHGTDIALLRETGEILLEIPGISLNCRRNAFLSYAIFIWAIYRKSKAPNSKDTVCVTFSQYCVISQLTLHIKFGAGNDIKTQYIIN